MSKFKVGDKVRVLCSDYHEIKVGEIKEIMSINDKGVDLFDDEGDSLYFYFSEIGPVEEKPKNFDITKDLKKALGFLELHDKDRFMMDNIVSTLEDKIDGIRRT